MNIEQGKNQVKYTVISYLSKDEFGDYIIPVERQRPLFLVGPPGIGKTDIMSQVAEEMGIGLVSYSMTHHTRQSALGLPFIHEKEYGGIKYRTTEYTMSEIIASVYDLMEATGRKEGILFLDEINCISETLAPSMLQFLQNKVFGRHRVPDGWVVVTAGNPPEYNDSVREMDIVTMDRLKRIDVEPDLAVWMKYAQNEGVHSSVISYLQIKKDDFYSVETTVDGKEFVTARGWVDLSEAIKLYEKNDLPVDIDLIRQYLQNERIARDFAAYYDLFFKFRQEYDVNDILNGGGSPAVLEKAGKAPFDERITVLRMLSDSLISDFRSISDAEEIIRSLVALIKEDREKLASGGCAQGVTILDSRREELKEELRRERMAHSISRGEKRVKMGVISGLSEMGTRLSADAATGDDDPVAVIRGVMAEKNREKEEKVKSAGARLENAFSFIEKTYGDDNEMLVFVTTLTENKHSSRFIGKHGSPGYFRHNKEVLFYDREKDLQDEIRGLEK